MDKISPKYRMDLEYHIKEKLFELYKGYEGTESYLLKWHREEEHDYYNRYENFYFVKGDNNKLNVSKTLSSMDDELILKVAIDLGIDTPDFIASVPIFRNEIKTHYETATATFERACREVEEHPDSAIGLANSALESIIKEIIKDERFLSSYEKNKTLYALASDLLKEFNLFPKSDMPAEIKTIGSSLLNIAKNIESIRSGNTVFHGKTQDDYIVNDPIYAYFVINSVSTVGLFLQTYYRRKFPKEIDDLEANNNDMDDLPF